MVTHSCRSSAGQGKFASQRPTFYHCATPPTSLGRKHSQAFAPAVVRMSSGRVAVRRHHLGPVSRRRAAAARLRRLPRRHQGLHRQAPSTARAVVHRENHTGRYTCTTYTRRHLRSANRHLLAVPRFRLNTYGLKAFSVAGPMAWNSHPDFIRDPTSSTDCFRRLLKPYLCARY